MYKVGGASSAMVLFLLLAMTSTLASAGKSWSKEHDLGNEIDVSEPKSHVKSLEVVCGRDRMTVHISFEHPFYGLVFSHPSPGHEKCVHIGPRVGAQDVSFDIMYDSCGTVEDLSGQFHENTIVIQFSEDILEAWDEAKRLRCEWLESFEKPSSKPTLAISDLDVVELNFQGDDIDCWMEVQEGKGPWARTVGGLVPIGSPLTLVIAINDHSREFDMRIKRCSASDGSGHEIELTDDNGCVLRTTLLTPFAKIRNFEGKATLVAYSHLYAFKFPDKMDVFIHCIVEVCRKGCPDSCSHQLNDYYGSREDFDAFESRKRRKLVELAKSSVGHNLHSHRYREDLKTDTGNSYPLPGREREILLPAAQQQVQQTSLHSSSQSAATLSNKTVVKQQRPTFKAAVSEGAQQGKKAQAHIKSSESNVHHVLTDIKNNIHSHHRPEFDKHTSVTSTLDDSQINQHIKAGNYHRIIGHDAHWISEDIVKTDHDSLRHPIPSLKEISRQIPQPEPATWSADEVKPLFKQEILHHSADPKHKQDLDFQKHHLDSPTEIKVHVPLFSDDARPEILPFHDHVLKELPQVPQPEPGTWTFEEINPMHSPVVPRWQHESKQHRDEPKPEPASWSLDDVKPLSKDDLRLLSLNHKMKSHNPVVVPVYKEVIHPYISTTLPQPIYSSGYTFSSQNMSNSNMMKMMMMMPTLLPYTYQTAQWPQRTSARLLSTNRHHYPYPIPQFSPHQKMMMSVIADRRMDTDNMSNNVSLYHKANNKDTIKHGDMLTEGASQHLAQIIKDIGSRENKRTESKTEKHIMIGETFQTASSEISKGSSSKDKIFADESFEILADGAPTLSVDHASAVTERLDGTVDVRPPITGFVPPSLDDGLEAIAEIKGRIAPGPRALDRRKRSSESIFGVRQKFQAIAPSDLAFEWNITAQSTAILRGRREEIVYGICMSSVGISAGVGFILILTLLSIIASVVLYEHSCHLSKKTSQLSFLTRNFNGHLESLYKFTRPYLYSDSRNVI